ARFTTSRIIPQSAPAFRGSMSRQANDMNRTSRFAVRSTRSLTSSRYSDHSSFRWRLTDSIAVNVMSVSESCKHSCFFLDPAHNLASMKRLALLLIFLAACANNGPAEQYGFVTTLGRDTISVENVTHEGHQVTLQSVDRFPRLRERK